MSTQRIISWRVYKSVSPLATLSAAPLLPAGRRRRNAAVTPPRRRGPAASRAQSAVSAESVNMVLIYRRCVEKIRNISILVNSVWMNPDKIVTCMHD